MAATAIEIFCLYAAEDKTWVDDFQKHLADLKRNSTVEPWYDGLLDPGAVVESEHQKHLNSANIILLFISVDFIANNRLMEQDLPCALERSARGETLVIPVLVRPCAWRNNSSFGGLQPLPANGEALSAWADRDAALMQVVEGINVFVHEQHVPALKTALLHLPYTRNQLFTGREEPLQQLHESLQKHAETVLTQAIVGLGGIGKTQTALEYAYRHQHDYSSIIWLLAESRETLLADISRLARELNLPGSREQDIQLIAQIFLNWLSKQRNWLLILDNVEDLALVREYTPKTGSGRLLLTTRKRAVGGGTARIALDEMSTETGAYFLLKRAKLIESDTSLEKINPQKLKLAQQLSDLLGGLPLALDQAGGYIERTECSLSRYIQLYQQAHEQLLAQPGNLEDTSAYRDTVATTWSLSFQAIANEPLGLVATDLLRFCAFLAPENIPLEIFEDGAEELGPQLSAVAANPVQLEEAISLLLRYSLIDREDDTFSLHRLVQTVLRDDLKPYSEEWLTWAKRAIHVMLYVFPDSNIYYFWNLCQFLLPHMLVCANWIDEAEIIDEASALLLNRLGYYLWQQGFYNEAKPLLEQVLQINQAMLGDKHPDTASSMNNLASLYQSQGEYEQAEPLYMQALQINRVVRGEQDSETARSLNNLAALYYSQERYEKAEPLYIHALQINRMVLGEEHPHIARSLNNLAALYRAQEKYEQAGRLYEQALQINRAVWGEEHPDTARSLNNLGYLYQAQGAYQKAGLLYEQAFIIVLNQLGENHHTTQAIAGNYFALKKHMEEREEN